MEGKERSPVPLISAAVLALVVLVVGGWMFRSRAPDGIDEPALMRAADRLSEEGDSAFAAWNQARKAKDTQRAAAERTKALTAYERALDGYEDVLGRYRDPNSGMLPTEYEGYEVRLQHIAVRLVDLGRG